MKVCPKCGKDHDKSGIFCSRTCANSRTWTDADKQKKRNAALSSRKVKYSYKRTSSVRNYKAAATKLGISLDEWYQLRSSGRLSSQNKTRYSGCRNCGQIREKHKIICEQCRLTYYNFYRPSCEFKFNIADYKSWFDVDLLRSAGMYKASNKGNNLGGVSRDHMLSIKSGFLNKIDPSIIKHPANCRLVLHSDNNKKGSSSIITYEELLERIELFDALAE